MIKHPKSYRVKGDFIILADDFDDALDELSFHFHQAWLEEIKYNEVDGDLVIEEVVDDPRVNKEVHPSNLATGTD